MSRLVLVLALAALALPVSAQAKELDGVTLCGPDGCTSGTLTGFGHDEPMSPLGGDGAPPPGPFYRLSFTVDGRADAWNGLYYEPRSGLIAFAQGPGRWMAWNRPAPAVAALAKRLARTVTPFPSPTVTEVRIGKRVLRDDAASYLALLRLQGEYTSPLADEPGVGIRFATAGGDDPWTSGGLVFYPADDVLVRGSGQSYKVPAELAADIGAVRPLGSGRPTVIPWLPIGIAGAGVLLLLALRWARRGAPGAERPARATIPSA